MEMSKMEREQIRFILFYKNQKQAKFGAVKAASKVMPPTL